MNFTPKNPPRRFEVGRGARIELSDCGTVELAPDEQVTFRTESGAEYDLARKSWGFYATPSLNGRLKKFRLRGVLVKSPASLYHVFLVEEGKEADFQRYIDLEKHVIVAWLDSDEALARLEGAVRRA
jgi:hypothetical protein